MAGLSSSPLLSFPPLSLFLSLSHFLFLQYHDTEEIKIGVYDPLRKRSLNTPEPHLVIEMVPLEDYTLKMGESQRWSDASGESERNTNAFPNLMTGWQLISHTGAY